VWEKEECLPEVLRYTNYSSQFRRPGMNWDKSFIPKGIGVLSLHDERFAPPRMMEAWQMIAHYTELMRFHGRCENNRLASTTQIGSCYMPQVNSEGWWALRQLVRKYLRTEEIFL
jgi:hypothetical protein